jgi:aminoglycoside phosphotransferase (APT) family kinase protein
MQVLGKKLGEGATAEVYEFGEDYVIKVVKPTISASIIDYEAWVTRTVSEAGAVTPTVGELVDVDGRRGFVMERVEGRPLLEVILTGEMTPEVCGRILAELTYALHGVSAGATSLRSFHEYAGPMLNQLDELGFPSPVLDEARRILEALDAGDAICHGDLNPNNVLMTVDGPRVIDWISAMRGNPLVDLARIAVTLSVVLIPEDLHPGLSTDAFWDMRHRMLSTYLETYAGLTGTSPEILDADLVPWMTVMATLALDEGTPDQQAWLLSYLQQQIADGE